MLKNRNTPYQIPAKESLSVAPNFEISKVWQFIDCNISGFPSYYQSIKGSDKENGISETLIYYFFHCLSEQLGGFPPYYFGKNPTQSQSEKETDVGVFLIESNKPITLIEFEAKRLSKASNNKEYVCGKRGGIERFKRQDHASHLSVCGMLGYVQNSHAEHWVNKINRWIHELSDINTDATIRWSKDEILTRAASFPNVEKYSSSHQRLSLKAIFLWRYFIEL
ncbi:MAG: hypothetical protein LBJ57_08380 [Prevotellaceae bacterium]|jgi:hypothetical protein|nr:hypothetical protein [Prevotellaceae bacterium]